ncbi:hypothetical protein BU600_06665 [Staphylococcus arlettae]|uniref:Putative staphylococcal protein n=1 Tax=Staphylococcus arlettae TaxID=29378 RepID=A0A2T7BUS4_9STAP|nr:MULTISPECIES: hypothetical protein [Staphylococcus]KAB2480153.1 hypothetical protein F9B39_04655 [Staphylococcus sp. CH99b_3]MBF0737696.1 hypothetical protein [Staphylococcus arlettae]MCD8814784.1 hypothetical protein [Staphylococcus arlettae]MCD8838226.1 hypothetical protein [Staphylococcus arlettae]MCD8865601.1 hypothetical protein [Staphylococcus arlettae]
MNLGIIIFVISVVVTIIGAIRDNSHKQRQQQQPKKNPQQESQPKRGFFEELERKFNELEEEFDPSRQSDRKSSNPEPPTPQPTETTAQEEVDRHTESKQQPESTPSKNKSEENLKKELEDSLLNDLKDVRSEMDREQEKQLQRMDKKARAIINDQYLSARTKRFRLKQLMQNYQSGSTSSQNDLRFDEDEVVNGIVWSEILNQPKRL